MSFTVWRTPAAIRMLIPLLLLLLHSITTTQSYSWSTGGRPEVNRRAIAGIWRLRTGPAFPLKEFTVYPKKTKPQDDPELLLSLKEDGSFQQCENTEKQKVDIDKSWKIFQKLKKSKAADLLKGTWDYVDGKLILAADRPSSDGGNQKESSDTLLVGRVVATYESKLQQNPALSVPPQDSPLRNEEVPPKNDNTQDAHLSVPAGRIKVGRFFYPRHHPSFFEQPMFQPVQRGSFSLRQVLGSLNTQYATAHDVAQEKFQCRDFYNKTFLLTSHPIGYSTTTKTKKKESWRKQKKSEESRPTANIRVMQVLFHANNTFSTTAGLGESILRGKFDVIGRDKDQLWFQVWRFGFGRSVSGSVYSEGRMLTHDDAKVYWGTIRYEQEILRNNSSVDDGGGGDSNTTLAKKDHDVDEARAENVPQRLEIKGSVMFGWGIEPVPEARFIMRELSQEDILEDLDEEEEEEEEEEDKDKTERMRDTLEQNQDQTVGSDGVDWSPESTDSFQ